MDFFARFIEGDLVDPFLCVGRDREGGREGSKRKEK